MQINSYIFDRRIVESRSKTETSDVINDIL